VCGGRAVGAPSLTNLVVRTPAFSLGGVVRSASLGVCAIAALLASCSTNWRVTAKPGAANLSGSYRFAGIEKARPENFPSPLIDWADVALHSDVTLEQTNDARIVARYTSTRGNLVEREVLPNRVPGTTFEKGMLTFKEQVPLADAPIFPGRVKQFSGSRYFKDADGNLRVIGFFMETGWMLFFIPFSDHHEHELVLKAAD
jgi:hypothetical protein